MASAVVSVHLLGHLLGSEAVGMHWYVTHSESNRLAHLCRLYIWRIILSAATLPKIVPCLLPFSHWHSNHFPWLPCQLNIPAGNSTPFLGQDASHSPSCTYSLTLTLSWPQLAKTGVIIIGQAVIALSTRQHLAPFSKKSNQASVSCC